jgi:hypothetical protein
MLDLTKLPQEQLDVMADGCCGYKTRNPMARHPYCHHKAGERTDHVGVGPCWLHGGRSMKLKSQRYEKLESERFRTLTAEHEDDEAPLDTLPELAAARAIFEDFLNRYDTYTAALMAWHESYTPSVPWDHILSAVDRLATDYETEVGPSITRADRNFQVVASWLLRAKTANPKPLKLMDISDAMRHLSEITKIVERIRKDQAATAVSRKDFVRILTEIGNIISVEVEDERAKRRIRDKISALRLA